MKILILVAMPLTLAACAAPAPLPDAEALGLAATQTAAFPTSAPVPNLFHGFTARQVAGPGDWLGLNNAQAPQGALQ